MFSRPEQVQALLLPSWLTAPWWVARAHARVVRASGPGWRGLWLWYTRSGFFLSVSLSISSLFAVWFVSWQAAGWSTRVVLVCRLRTLEVRSMLNRYVGGLLEI